MSREDECTSISTASLPQTSLSPSSLSQADWKVSWSPWGKHLAYYPTAAARWTIPDRLTECDFSCSVAQFRFFVRPSLEFRYELVNGRMLVRRAKSSKEEMIQSDLTGIIDNRCPSLTAIVQRTIEVKSVATFNDRYAPKDKNVNLGNNMRLCGISVFQ